MIILQVAFLMSKYYLKMSFDLKPLLEPLCDKDELLPLSKYLKTLFLTKTITTFSMNALFVRL